MKMTKSDYSFFDTDLILFLLSPDPPVRNAAQLELKKSKPTAMSAFSLVELKGNYISNLILLRRKISDSDTFGEAYSRIQNTGGRKATLMLSILVSWLGGTDYSINPWTEARNNLTAILDSQIKLSWEEFKNDTDKIFNDFHCTRATEEPIVKRGVWSARIPRCRKNNTKCTIVKFMSRYKRELANLVQELTKLERADTTKELERIKNIAKICLEKKSSPWQDNICRQVGDLLIGLQSKEGGELISSNFREHSKLHGPLGYSFREFPIVKIRSI